MPDLKSASYADVKEDKNDISQDIDPANEVRGMKLVLINIAICLCTFLVGLVSPPLYPSILHPPPSFDNVSVFNILSHTGHF